MPESAEKPSARNLLERVASAIEKQKPSKGGGAKSWWRWPLLIVLVLLGFAVMAWFSNRHRRELARLRHEQFKRENAEAQAKTDAKVAASDAERDKRLLAVAASEERLKEIDDAVDAVEKDFRKDLATIDRVRLGDLPRGE